MRGDNLDQADVFSYLSPEQRVPQDHPLRAVRAMADDVPLALQAVALAAPVRASYIEKHPARVPASFPFALPSPALPWDG